MEKINQYAIWIDPTIDVGENIYFSKELEDMPKTNKLLKVKTYKEINETIEYMKNIDFNETKVILSGKLYSDYK